ncbi:hypothetical protein LTR94_036533, partial [Friedmanniomyces endolithicus]
MDAGSVIDAFWLDGPLKISALEQTRFLGRLAQGKLPVIRRNIGSKLIKMEFTNEAKAGRSVKTVDVPIELRNRYSLVEEEVIELAKYAMIIENHYGRPMDIEWGKDGRDGKL